MLLKTYVMYQQINFQLLIFAKQNALSLFGKNPNDFPHVTYGHCEAGTRAGIHLYCFAESLHVKDPEHIKEQKFGSFF